MWINKSPCSRWFAPMDSRSTVLSKYTCTGANPQAAMEKLRGVLVSDAYGLVLGVRVARDAYNARPGLLIFRFFWSTLLSDMFFLFFFSRHAMHVVFQTHDGGELWLGGISAAGSIATLLDNGITGILSAASTPPVVKDHRLTDYGTLDGTGLMANWPQLKERARSLTVRILEDVLNGKKVLVSCRNGAHRSATQMAILLMALSRDSADQVHTYLRNLRNIVDLESFHPSQGQSSLRQTIPKPIDVLREKREEILAFWAGRPNMPLMGALPPAAFADLADTAGLERLGQDRVFDFFLWGDSGCVAFTGMQFFGALYRSD